MMRQAAQFSTRSIHYRFPQRDPSQPYKDLARVEPSSPGFASHHIPPTMLLPNVPTLFNLLVVNVVLNKFDFAHQSCLTDNYYGMYGSQNLFMLGTDPHCDLSELKTGMESRLNPIPVHPYRELLFVKKMEVEGVRTDEYLTGSSDLLLIRLITPRSQLVPNDHSTQMRLRTPFHSTRSPLPPSQSPLTPSNTSTKLPPFVYHEAGWDLEA